MCVYKVLLGKKVLPMPVCVCVLGLVGCLRTLEVGGVPVDLRSLGGTSLAHRDIIYDNCQVNQLLRPWNTCCLCTNFVLAVLNNYENNGGIENIKNEHILTVILIMLVIIALKIYKLILRRRWRITFLLKVVWVTGTKAMRQTRGMWAWSQVQWDRGRH